MAEIVQIIDSMIMVKMSLKWPDMIPWSHCNLSKPDLVGPSTDSAGFPQAGAGYITTIEGAGLIQEPVQWQDL